MGDEKEKRVMGVIHREGIFGTALYSSCMKYRYGLKVKLEGIGVDVAFICLNPSTADHDSPDPTVSRCIVRCNKIGASSFTMLNLFAFRATDPKDMKAQTDPVGEHNNQVIHETALRSGMIVLAWGTHGSYTGRDKEVVENLQSFSNQLYYILKTKGGEPRHPLYLPYSEGFKKF